MIDFDTQIKIQAFLDGELAGDEAREVVTLIAGDQEAAALLGELKNTRRALSGAEQGITLPETREFYWSKIRRDIEKVERAQPALAPVSPWHTLVRWIRPIGVVAVVAVISLLVWQQMDGGNGLGAIVTAQIDSDAITYQDAASGTTFVWFNYPAENGVANDAGATTLYQ